MGMKGKSVSSTAIVLTHAAFLRAITGACSGGSIGRASLYNCKTTGTAGTTNLIWQSIASTGQAFSTTFPGPGLEATVGVYAVLSHLHNFSIAYDQKGPV